MSGIFTWPWNISHKTLKWFLPTFRRESELIGESIIVNNGQILYKMIFNSLTWNQYQILSLTPYSSWKVHGNLYHAWKYIEWYKRFMLQWKLNYRLYPRGKPMQRNIFHYSHKDYKMKWYPVWFTKCALFWSNCQKTTTKGLQ